MLTVKGVSSKKKQLPFTTKFNAAPEHLFVPSEFRSKTELMYRYWPPTLTNTRQAAGNGGLGGGCCPIPFLTTVKEWSVTLKVRIGGLTPGRGTSSQPSRILLAKKLADDPLNGRMTRNR